MKNATVVEFELSYPPYYKGDVAGFTADLAESLINRKIAKPYIAKKEQKNG